MEGLGRRPSEAESFNHTIGTDKDGARSSVAPASLRPPVAPPGPLACPQVAGQDEAGGGRSRLPSAGADHGRFLDHRLTRLSYSATPRTSITSSSIGFDRCSEASPPQAASNRSLAIASAIVFAPVFAMKFLRSDAS